MKKDKIPNVIYLDKYELNCIGGDRKFLIFDNKDEMEDYLSEIEDDTAKLLEYKFVGERILKKRCTLSIE